VLPTRLGRTFAALTASQVITRSIRLGYLAILVRFLSPNDVGIYLHGLAFYLALSVFAGFGQGPLLGATLHKQREQLGALLGQSLACLLLATFVTTACGLGFLALSEDDVTVRAAAGIYLVSLVARTYVGWVRDSFVALEDAAWIPRYEFVFRASEAIAGVVGLAAGGGVYWLCAIHSAVWVVEALFCRRRLVLRLSSPIKLRRALRGISPFARRSLVFLLSSSFTQLFFQVGIIILTARIGDTATVGQFGISMQILGTLAIVPMMLGTAMVPAVGRIRHGGGSELTGLQTIAKLSLLLGACFGVLAQVVAPWLFTVVFGAKYAEAGEMMAVLSWALGPYAVAHLASSSLNGLGWHRSAAIVAVVMVSIHVVGLWILWPFGVTSAVQLSLVVGAVLGALVGVVAVTAALDVGNHVWWLGPAAVFVAAAAWMRQTMLDQSVAAAIALVAIAVVVVALRIVSRAEVELIRVRLGLASGKRTGD
jgi:O-antigen/teichoic acid export membrane protein